MSTLEFIHAVVRYRKDLAFPLTVLGALVIALTYHALTNPMLAWLR